MHSFKKTNTSALSYPISKIPLQSLDAIVQANAIKENGFGLFQARFRGSLLHLFGEPTRTSIEYQDAYEYIVQSTDEKGVSLILTAYQGPSGPAIGGKAQDDTSRLAAQALFQFIIDTPPADFEATLYDHDTDYTIVYGCQSGTCYYSETKGYYIP